MRALVTGGAGFIGSHLAERLLTDGHAVTVLDNLSTGQKENCSAFERHAKFRFVQADITDSAACKEHFEGIDWVFHMAALADIVPSVKDPERYFKVNVAGTVNALECARAAGVRRFLYIASSTCYGIADAVPTPETAPIRTEYPYALTKHLGETCVLHWAKVYHMPAVSLRCFNVYGPRSRTTGAYGAVFGVFLAQKLHGRPFTVVGDGNQTRDFTYVTDVVDAFLCAAASGLSGEVVNVGTGEGHSVNEIVSLLGGPVVFVPKRPGEPDHTRADIAKIRRLLGWSPRVRFADGVLDLMKHIEHWREAPVWTPDSVERATRDWFTYLGQQP